MNTIFHAIKGKEQKAIESAADLGIVLICPTSTVEVRPRKWSRRLQKFIRWHRRVERVPVIPYLFADIPDDQLHKASQIRHVRSGYIRAETRRDIASLSDFMARCERGEFNHDGVYGHLLPGQVMRLIGGIFDQMLGSFEGMRADKVVVTVDAFGRKTKVAVGPEEVEVA